MSKIAIIGGGIIGSSIAWNLAKSGLTSELIVIEPDPTYEFAATPRAIGGIRFVQGLIENLKMSLYGRYVFKNFARELNIQEDFVDLNFHECGYLFLGTGNTVKAFEENYRMLSEGGADIKLMDRRSLESLLPSFNFKDIDVGLYSPSDSRIDPYSALRGFKRAAIDLGVEYKKDRVVDINHDHRRVNSVKLESGTFIPVDIIINAANCWAPDICKMVGMKVPIEPVRRQTFYFNMEKEIEKFPAIRDHNGLSVRPDGAGFIAGKTAVGGKKGFNWELDYREFENELWHLMASRSPFFETIKYKGGWVGHYDQCLLDGNPILGPWENGLSNFILAAGFSGHGLQHAPAISLALSEQINHGEAKSFDLSRFSYKRVEDNKPLGDTGPTP